MNVQYVIYEDPVYVLEVNPRASRTVPFMSKVIGVPMVAAATRAMLDRKPGQPRLYHRSHGTSPLLDCKSTRLFLFFFEKLGEVTDVFLGPEDEINRVRGLGHAQVCYYQALYKAISASGGALYPEAVRF